jgi:DNA-binding HxlR family transcriptional regulator
MVASISKAFLVKERLVPPRKPTPLPGRAVRGSRTGRPIMALLDLLGRRWALRVLWELRDELAPTFRELQERCGAVSSSVLADRLRELDEAAIVTRNDRGYILTAAGADLLGRLLPLDDWASRWASSQTASIRLSDSSLVSGQPARTQGD